MSTTVERVTEYLRQRKTLTRDLGLGIHAVWSDPEAAAVTLTVQDVEALLALAAQPKEPAVPLYSYAYHYVDEDSSGYYYIRWDRSTPITVVAPNKDEALRMVWAAAGTPPRGRHWRAKLQSVTAVAA